MDENDFKRVSEEIVSSIQSQNSETGNCFVKTPNVLRALFPNGIPAGREAEAMALGRIIDKMFRIANNSDNTKAGNLWCELSAYALNAVKASTPTIGQLMSTS